MIKPPVSYYGGKQNMAKRIAGLLPDHTQYVEPFFGGGAVFFAKHPSQNEVINDIDRRVVNFYQQLVLNFDRLKQLIEATPHSEQLYHESLRILNDENADFIQHAWAFWMRCTCSFGHRMINSGFRHSTRGEAGRTFQKKKRITRLVKTRLEGCEIFNRPALELIELKDHPDTLFYLDPPYYNSDMGHYDGYCEQNFIDLLEACAKMKGKFILSTYLDHHLTNYREKYKWHVHDSEHAISVSGKKTNKKTRRKTECLSMNFKPKNRFF